MTTEMREYTSLEDGVTNFMDLIAGAVQLMPGGSEVPVEMDFESCADEAEDQIAMIGTVRTEHGIVSVFPNFNEGVPVAYALDMKAQWEAKLRGMDPEEAAMWSRAFEYEARSVRILAYYLATQSDIRQAELAMG